MTSIGWDSAPAMLQALCSAWALGEVLLCLPLWEFKGLEFWVLQHSWCICPHQWQYSTESVLVISLSRLGWLFLAVSLFWLLLCHWDLWLLVLVLWLFFLWSLLEPCHWVCLVYLSSFNSGHQLLLHFDPLGRSLGVLVVIFSLFRQCITDYAQMDTYEVLCFSCSCSPLAFLDAHIRAM